MKLNRATAFAAVLVIMLGGAIIASSIGLFDTESSKSAATIKAGEFEGMADPNDIRGSFSFADISKQFSIEVGTLADAFVITGDPEALAAFQAKGLEEKYAGLPQEIGTSSVRLFVGFMTGLPVELGAYLPQEAAQIIRESGVNLTEERLSYLDSHSIDISQIEKTEESTSEEAKDADDPPAASTKLAGVTAAEPLSTDEADSLVVDPAEGTGHGGTAIASEGASIEATPDEPGAANPAKQGQVVEEGDLLGSGASDVTGAQAAQEEVHETKKEDRAVKGNTTIFDLMSWGVAREKIGPALGIELPGDNGAKLKDLVTAAGKSFEDAKAILQEMVDESN